MHLSWGSVPYSARQNQASVYPAGPTASTVRPQGFSPSRRLAPPETMQGLFHPRCAHGVPSFPSPRTDLSIRQGCLGTSFLFTAFSSPVTDTFWRALPSCATPFSFVGTLSGHDASDDLALHGLDHRRIGVSQGSEPGAPTVLRFAANYTLVNSERLLGPWVSPPLSGGVAATIQPLRNLPRPHLLQLHEPASLPQTRQIGRAHV